MGSILKHTRNCFVLPTYFLTKLSNILKPKGREQLMIKYNERNQFMELARVNMHSSVNIIGWGYL